MSDIGHVTAADYCTINTDHKHITEILINNYNNIQKYIFFFAFDIN